MKIKSIKVKITVLAGLCLLITSAVIIGYSAITLRHETLQARERAIEDAKAQVAAVAKQHAMYIRAEIEVALDAARTLAQTFSGIKDEEAGVELGRDEVNSILRIVLARNSQFVGTYTCWEPDAIDGMDRGYENAEGHDGTGRFIPYWSRSESGSITVGPLLDYEKEGAGDYYILPRKTKNESFIDPYIYPVQGKDTLITSLVVPIIVNDTFYGIAGVDLRLDFLQELADGIDIYDGAAEVMIVSNNGTLAAVTGRPELSGKHMKEMHQRWQEDMEYVKKGEHMMEIAEGKMNVFAPISVGKSSTPWSINIRLPEEKVTAAADMQMAKAQKSIIKMIGISILCAILALTALWFVAVSISRPVRAVVKFSEQLNRGDLSVSLETGIDEIGEMGAALNAVVDELKKKAAIAAAIGKGDLSHDIKVASEADTLGKALRDMTANLNHIIGELHLSVSQVDAGSNQVSDSSQSLSQGATEQASSLEEITSSMSEIAGQTKTNAENATQANQLATSARDAGQAGAHQMEEMVGAMGSINESSKEIGKIIKVIDDIAFQTNLLALNAAVEAARAGKHGKGFAVVAQEVRSLAARSAKAAQETSDLIEGSIKKVEDGSNIAEKTAKALEEINEGVAKVADLVGEISAASNEQAQGISQINQGLSQVDGVTQQNTANAEETSSAAEELSSQAAQVNQLLSRFKLKGATGVQTDSIQSAESVPKPGALPAELTQQPPVPQEAWGQPVSESETQDQPARPEEVISLDDDEFGKY